jgi:hypothetical protein
MRTEPQPLSITASGGKKMARRTLNSDMLECFFVCGHKSTILLLTIQVFGWNTSVDFMSWVFVEFVYDDSGESPAICGSVAKRCG